MPKSASGYPHLLRLTYLGVKTDLEEMQDCIFMQSTISDGPPQPIARQDYTHTGGRPNFVLHIHMY